MSKYEETMHGCNRICPYCKSSYQVETEDYTDDQHEEECYECGKKYYAYESFSVDYFAKPDCILNGYPHQWERLSIKNGGYNFCSVCGEGRRI